jgi:hypothetical protein
MKQEIIGRTPKEQLWWVVNVIERTLPRSEEGWLNLKDEIRLFVGSPTVRVIDPATLTDHKRFQQFFKDLLTAYNDMIDRAVERDRGATLTTPRTQETLVWDESIGRFRKESIRQREMFVTLAIRRLNDLLLAHGHLLKRCEAPARMRPGRKPDNAPKSENGGVCGNLFVAERQTQVYCSIRCSNRAQTRMKRAKDQEASLNRALTHRPKPKKRKRKPK